MAESFSQEDERRRALMDAIFREHFFAVRHYISDRIRQPDVVDDLTSQVFLKAFRWLREDRGIGQVRSWLYSTARTTIADYWQEQQKNLFVPLEGLEERAMVQYTSPDDEQTQQRVYHLLHLLPERERQVLLLRYFQGYSAAEVGRELGLNEGYVRVLQLRALRRAALLKVKERSLPLMDESAHIPITVYTKEGQRVLDLAKEEALSFHHYYIGTEHLLMGILSDGSAAASLIEQGATLARVRAELLAVVGKNKPDPHADAPLTPRTRQILETAGKIASKQGEQAISPEHILHALIDEKRGIAVQMLQSMGVNLDRWQTAESKSSDEELERYVRRLEYWVEHTPQVSEEEERRLAHLVARSKVEQRRAELLKETPDVLLLSEGESAYDRLIKVSQHLVLTVAKDYFKPGRDKRKIIIAGNEGLSRAVSTFGLKKQTSFRTYAMYMIHLQIIEILE